MPLVGFLFDTTLAAAQLVFAGVPERYPDIKWVLVPPRRRDPVPGRAARSRLPRVRGLPREHRAAAERLPEAVLLRHGQLRPGRDRAGDRVRRRRPHPGRQRLPAPDRQHPEDARCMAGSTSPERSEGDDSWRECGKAAAGFRFSTRSEFEVRGFRVEGGARMQIPMYEERVDLGWSCRTAGIAVGARQQQAAGHAARAAVREQQVRVWKSIIMPNQPLALHRHDHGRTIVALKGGTLDIVDAKGQDHEEDDVGDRQGLLARRRSGGRAARRHERGNEPMEVIVVELKNDVKK